MAAAGDPSCRQLLEAKLGYGLQATLAVDSVNKSCGLLSSVLVSNGAVDDLGSHVASGAPVVAHFGDSGLNGGRVSDAVDQSGNSNVSRDGSIGSQLGMAGSDVAVGVVGQLSVLGAQEQSQLQSSLLVLAVGVNADALGASECTQLLASSLAATLVLLSPTTW